jgi:hypothetical protein
MTTKLITTPLTREITADEVSAGIGLTGRRAIVTGAASFRHRHRNGAYLGRPRRRRHHR